MKRLECNDLVPGCDAVVEAETEEEILSQAGRHAVEDHGLEVTPEFVEQARSQIREVQPST
jgi:predicted small metal-binding protein